MLDHILDRISRGDDLSMEEMAGVIDLVMQGQCADEQVASLLLGLREKGETVDEVAGAAAAMRQHMTPIQSSREQLVDTCGTGGDGSGTFNISTAAALVTAAAGVAVAKHGNRKITSKTGSADVLAELGVNVEAPVEVVENCLDELGICFCYAPHLHPSMKHVATVRRSLSVPTIFNMLGPLCNPAGASCQLLGVGRAELRGLLAEALSLLGAGRAIVVCGADGLDEITLNGITNVSLVENGQISEQQWSPEDFGLESCSLDDLAVDDATGSAAMIRTVLDDQPGPARDIVVLNAAAAIWLARPEGSLDEAAGQAAAAIQSGAASGLLDQLAMLSQGT
ncbi:MAG: anthranilate phosphoribosyltransferase [Pirellulaceae bacterium]